MKALLLATVAVVSGAASVQAQQIDAQIDSAVGYDAPPARVVEDAVPAEGENEVSALRRAELQSALEIAQSREQPLEVRLGVLRSINAVHDTEQARSLAALYQDREEPIALRVTALSLAVEALRSDARFRRSLYETLTDREAPLELRHATANAVGRVHFYLSFLQRTEAISEAEMPLVEALTDLKRDRDQQLRQFAYLKLMNIGHDVTEAEVNAMLLGRTDPALPRETLIALIGVQLDIDAYYTALRDVLVQSRSVRERELAARLLGGDDRAEPILTRIALDEEADPALRLASLGGLHAGSRSGFEAAARSILQTPPEQDAALKVFAIDALSLTRSRIDWRYREGREDDELDRLIRPLTGRRTPDELRQAAERYFERTRP